MKPEEIPHGPVYITAGPHKGRIGYYDDEDYEFPEEIDCDDSKIDLESEALSKAPLHLADGGPLRMT